MKITLKSLRILNFKGVKEFEINLKHITNIFGDNATGKTTIFDAFLWLFFGKNSEDVSQFEVKRLDDQNRFIKDLEAEVSAIIQIDDQEVQVKKVLRQKWVKRRGELEANYNGDENIYYWNDVPLKEVEFKTKIKAIVDETLFKLITNPFYFNSLKWQQRRDILIEIAGNVSNEDVFDQLITAQNKSQFNSLISALNSGKTIDEFKRELSAKKKKIKDEAESIPSRIDEVRRGMPSERDYEPLKHQKILLQEKAQNIQSAISNELSAVAEGNKKRAEILKNYQKEVSDHHQFKFDLKTKIQNIEFDVKQKAKESSGKIDAEIKSLTRQLADKNLDLEKYKKSVSNLKSKYDQNEIYIADLRIGYNKIDAEVLEFSETEFICPSCHQELPHTDIETKREELTTNFNTSKRLKLEGIIKDAENLKTENAAILERIKKGMELISQSEREISELQTQIDKLQQEALTASTDTDQVYNSLLDQDLIYQGLKNDLATSEAKVFQEPVIPPTPTNDELYLKLKEATEEINALDKILSEEELIKKGNARIQELETQESKLAQELVELEGAEFSILEFTKAKVDAIDRRLNAKFKYVRFKMFDVQVNGGEAECCETLINGVPFSDANNAARINAGIEIINTLSEHYQVFAPIFIDNRESVTKLIESQCQIINLFVSENDKKLRVA